MIDPKDDDIAAAGWWSTERKEMGIGFAVLLFFGWLMYWYLGPEEVPTAAAPVIAAANPQPAPVVEPEPVVEPVRQRREPEPVEPVAPVAAAAAVAVPKPVIEDRDNDGVIDTQDQCPDEAGIAENNGCPKVEDRDSDGVADARDQCPDEAGIAENNGCPKIEDGDGDGIVDTQDKCPDEAGIAENDGCPKNDDSDGDGIANALDQCPDKAGIVENSGCPKSEISESDQATLAAAVKNVSFATGSSVLTESSKSVLNAVADILMKNDRYDLVISGHSDSSGNAQSNLNLSAERAKSCGLYIASRGVDISRIRATGFGASSPRATNDTPEGRKRNRRVEFDLVER